jgi:hypothetical protein
MKKQVSREGAKAQRRREESQEECFFILSCSSLRLPFAPLRLCGRFIFR